MPLSLRFRIWRHDLVERLASWIAYRLPRKVVYYATIRLWAYATTGKWSDTVAPKLRLGEALTRWDLAGTVHDRPEPTDG